MPKLNWDGDDFRNLQDSSGTVAGNISRNGSLRQGYKHGSLTEGLVAYYPMDAGSGSTLTDQVLGNDGTLRPGSSGTTNTSGMWSTNSKIGEACLSFDGQDDYVGVGNISLSNPLQLSNSPSSFSARVYQESGGDRWQRVVDKSNDGNGKNGYALFLDSQEQSIWLTVDGDKYITGSGAYSFGEWNHIVGIVKESEFKIFLNGSEISASWDGSPQLPPEVQTDMKIGSWNHNLTDNTRFWQGRIDDVRIYSRALSTPEIKALYELEKPSKVTAGDILQ